MFTGAAGAEDVCAKCHQNHHSEQRFSSIPSLKAAPFISKYTVASDAK